MTDLDDHDWIMQMREEAAKQLDDLPHIQCEVRMGLRDDTLKKEADMVDSRFTERNHDDDRDKGGSNSG